MNGTLPKIQLIRLLYTHYQHVNLGAANKFFIDFGLKVVQEDEEKIFYRGFGENPFVYIAEKSPGDSKTFVCGGWLVQSKADLERASKLATGSAIQKFEGPGGGHFVDLLDPNGVKIRLHFGITMRLEDEVRSEMPKAVMMNSWVDKPRKGEFQRFDRGPSNVHKLGHYGLVVDKSKFEATVDFYISTFTFAKTDSLFDEKTDKDMMTFMHIDRGTEFSDHHSFFIQSPPEPVPFARPHHSSFEIDSMDSQVMGHYYLQEEGWTNCWGIGRHLLGSQIFDYWFDPSGNIVEHYSDGDLVNSKTIYSREVAAPNTMAVWGPNVSLAFLTTRMEDL
ncbi:Glyoxalase/Bleomycin resistance protein/Dihydroxybiphenyl dioxygenase [Aaosphaeria arxii CBS 175.79]|uniref:Glyoxalase/Bleomycin resistance protein/Dihydroxybiphenyl dioxygenase n=1 Tax=Aaosphaeria arxii CBS 175.79 TaxID=1450172 RepID=A0A6A5X961_9PLEO|nr:Glyoxalase/Bleomycin resistance protein/Dihydroxybiphenyl dioxygenase [Aaosphaeria arxii CBS 175.79]KAF2009473.1 Glyoxalase/Bleomycin resistance protein/Dihydroxybiphenyl dioxygenase [Aaosphaeria arxii CBS 175.79]